MFVLMNVRSPLVLAFLILALSSCVRDLHEQITIPEPPCEGPLCGCVDGFEGPLCNLRSIEKFLGTYERGQASCPESAHVVGKHRVTDSKYGVLFIEIHDGLHDQPIYAETDGWNFIIPEQENSITDAVTKVSNPQVVHGYGWLDLEGGKFVYQLYNQLCHFELRLEQNG